MIKILASLAIATALLTSPVQAASTQNINHVSIAPGVTLSVIGYCNGTKAAKGLSAAIALGSEKGFMAYMKDKNNLCMLQGMHAGDFPIQVIVTKKAWEVISSDGDLFEFWAFKDGAGDLGYTWQNMSVNTIKPLKTKPKGRGA